MYIEILFYENYDNWPSFVHRYKALNFGIICIIMIYCTFGVISSSLQLLPYLDCHAMLNVVCMKTRIRHVTQRRVSGKKNN